MTLSYDSIQSRLFICTMEMSAKVFIKTTGEAQSQSDGLTRSMPRMSVSTDLSQHVSDCSEYNADCGYRIYAYSYDIAHCNSCNTFSPCLIKKKPPKFILFYCASVFPLSFQPIYAGQATPIVGCNFVRNVIIRQIV